MSTEGEQTEKSPSDEGFTDLEPTINWNAEETQGSSLTTHCRDNYEHVGPNCLNLQEPRDYSALSRAKGRLDDEEDEGVAQNSSIEDGVSVLSALETEKQGSLQIKPLSQQVAETKDTHPEGAEELLNRVEDKTPRRLSLQEASEVERRSLDRLAEGDRVSEEVRQKKNQESEMRSWLLKRMQVPIEGTSECWLLMVFIC